MASIMAVSCTQLLASPAHAGGFAVARFGGEHGTPTTGDVTAIYYNPAGLAFTTTHNVYVEGVFALRSFTYDRDPAAIDNVIPTGGSGQGTPAGTGVAANSGEGKLFNPVVSPFIGVATNFGVPNLGVALGFYTPFGGTSSWDKREEFENNTQFPGAVDGPARWHNIEGTIRSSYITAAGAYRFLDGKLSVGLGLNVVLSQVSTIRARNADGSDDLVTASGAPLEGRSFIDTSGVGFAAGLGIIFMPMPEMKLGLSYQSQPNFGEMTLSGTIQNKLGVGPATTGDVEITQTLPDVVRAGVEYRASQQLELRFWGDFTRWSTFRGQCILDASVADRACEVNDNGSLMPGSGGVIANIPRYWKNTFGFRGSASWYFSDALELMGGLGFDSNAVPDEFLETSLPDMTKVTASVGIRVKLLDQKLDLLANYLQVIYFSRDIEPRTTTQMNPSRLPDGAGSYSQWVGALSVGVGYHF